MQNFPHFIGYTSLEGWEQAIDRGQMVYAMLQSERHSQPPGYSKVRYVIQVMQPGNERVHYCRVPAGMTEWIGDLCVSEKPWRELREQRAKQAWELVQDWMKARGLQWREATVAIPAELRDGLLDGEAGFMGYSHELGFYPKESQMVLTGTSTGLRPKTEQA